MKQKISLITLTAALLAAPAFAAPAAPSAQQQLNQDCTFEANVAYDSMGLFQAGTNQATALKMLQQKYLKLVNPESQKAANSSIASINSLLYKQPKSNIHIGKTDAERQEIMREWGAAVYASCLNNSK